MAISRGGSRGSVLGWKGEGGGEATLLYYTVGSVYNWGSTLSWGEGAHPPCPAPPGVVLTGTVHTSETCLILSSLTCTAGLSDHMTIACGVNEGCK